MNVLLLNIISGVLILITFLLITVFDYKDNKKKDKASKIYLLKWNNVSISCFF